MTLEFVAKKLGSHKGYVSGIENGKVNPPSVALIKKFSKLFGQDSRALARLAWVDKAPEILREDAERFLKWCQANEQPAHHSGDKGGYPELPTEPSQTE
ncbi:MAG TPA: helix-turn-helix transcriptional regulator [Planctomycetota bacterium]|nr:helix-turn-helix transcriptional regulator [Planctomycetota bacterium]